jgi:hypothetical protein
VMTRMKYLLQYNCTYMLQTLRNAIRRNRQQGWITLHQQKYLTYKFQEFNMSNYNLISTHVPSSVHLNKEDCPTTYELMDITS